MNVGKRIKELRIKKGITVNKLANVSGISQSYLRDIELGNKQPTVEYLSYICDGLGISLATFFTDTESKKIVDLINKLTDNQKNAIIALIESII